MDVQTFQGHLLLLAEATNKELSDPLVVVWERKFGQLAESVFVAAIDHYTDGHKFWPTPAEFRDSVEAVMTPHERGIQEGIRLMRSWVAHGVLPPVRDAEEFRAVKVALGLPPPDAPELERLAAQLAERARVAALPPPEGVALPALPASSVPHGPVLARLLGTDRRAPIAPPSQAPRLSATLAD